MSPTKNINMTNIQLNLIKSTIDYQNFAIKKFLITKIEFLTCFIVLKTKS